VQDTVGGAGGSARADRRRDGWVSEDRLCDLVRRACRNSVEPKANGTLFNCEWIGRHGLAWPGAHACTRSHQHAGTSAHARTHTHAHAGQRCWSQCRWGVRPGPYAQTCEAFGLPGGHECDPTQRWHQNKVPKSWTNWTSHCGRVFRATFGVHRDVHGRARLGSGRSPRSEPGPTRTATRAADPSSRRRRSRQCERRASRCSTPQRPPQPAAATTRGSANHPRASTDPCLLDPSVRPFRPIARFEI